MIIIGHRGAKGLATENTQASIKKALEVGVDMIEIDLRLHENEVVLSHDHTIQTKRYCKLEKALSIVAGSVPLILEIKEFQVVNKLPALLQNYKGDILISSKKFDVLKEIRHILPDTNIAIIEKWSGIRAVAQASLLETQNVHINHHWLWSSFVRSMKHRGYNLFAYTVNDVERARELAEWGVDGIFTDYPDRMVNL